MSARGFPPPLFGIVSALVEERTGIHYDDADRELLLSKLTARTLEAGFESPLDYYYYLRYDDPTRREFDALVESLVVNETYFFREAPQLRALCETVILPLDARGVRPRIWCAAAATGEEPLTLAMLLAERGMLDRVDIVASDISARALSRAKEGTYGPRSFRGHEASLRERWFQPNGEQSLVRPDLPAAIDWRRVNLVDEGAVAALGKFDVIVCRNVLIYFSDDTVRRVASSLASALRDDGHLLVGASESLLRFGTLLTCEERNGSFFYRKAA
ncbi:MAG TPA: protein-glutamate O-methyltransferase CheR [Polyangiaceae bacterium]